MLLHCMEYERLENCVFRSPNRYFYTSDFAPLNRSKTVVPHQSYCTDLPQFIARTATKHLGTALLPWHTNNTFIIFSYLLKSSYLLVFKGFLFPLIGKSFSIRYVTLCHPHCPAQIHSLKYHPQKFACLSLPYPKPQVSHLVVKARLN